jgi:hypothetical protein
VDFTLWIGAIDLAVRELAILKLAARYAGIVVHCEKDSSF